MKVPLIFFVVAACVAPLAAPLAAQTADPVKPTTSFTGDLGYVSATGNTNLTTLSLGEKVVHSDGRWMLTQLGAYVYGESESKQSANQLRLAARADYSLVHALGVFGGVAFERNAFAGFNSRIDEIIGLRLRAIAERADSLDLDAGADFTQESDVNNTSQNYTSARFAGAYKHVFSKAAYFQQLAEYVPNIQQFGAYRLNTESAIIAPVSSHVGVKLNYAVRYDSRPLATFGTTDRVLTMGVQITY
jgi:putative salt-induced outer membrane protein